MNQWLVANDLVYCHPQHTDSSGLPSSVDGEEYFVQLLNGDEISEVGGN